MKKIIIAIALVLLAANAYAVDVETLDIKLTIDAGGNAIVGEDYILKFISPFEEQEFTQKAIQNSSSIGAWEAGNSFFYAHFGSSIEKISDSSITYDSSAKKSALFTRSRTRSQGWLHRSKEATLLSLTTNSSRHSCRQAQ